MSRRGGAVQTEYHGGVGLPHHKAAKEDSLVLGPSNWAVTGAGLGLPTPPCKRALSTGWALSRPSRTPAVARRSQLAAACTWFNGLRAPPCQLGCGRGALRQRPDSVEVCAGAALERGCNLLGSGSGSAAPSGRARCGGDGQRRAAPQTTRWYAGRQAVAAVTGRTRKGGGPKERYDTHRA
eukprot:scaffold55788_cov69-Phaeocystis_antarctica.AAC.2